MKTGGKIKTGLLILIALAMFSASIYNIVRNFRSAGKMADQIAENKKAGRPVHTAMDPYYPIVETVAKTVPQGKKILFWMPEDQRKTISTETLLIQLDYYLYPNTVQFTDDSDLTQYDYIIYRPFYGPQFADLLKEQGVLIRFVHVAMEKEIRVLRRRM